MKTSYGWRKVLARGRAVGSPHSDSEGPAREDFASIDFFEIVDRAVLSLKDAGSLPF